MAFFNLQIEKEQESQAAGRCRKSTGFISKCIHNDCCKTEPSIFDLSIRAGGFTA